MLHARQVGDEPLVAEAVDRARRVVDVAAAAGVVVEVVRRAERLHERPRQVVEGAAAIGKRDPAPAEVLDRLLQLVGDVVEGLVPGGPPPLAAAARAAADERRLRPLVVELERQAGRALRAQARAERPVVRVALQPGHPTVLDRHLHRAAHRAHAAHAVNGAPARGTHAADIRCHERAHSSHAQFARAEANASPANRLPGTEVVTAPIAPPLEEVELKGRCDSTREHQGGYRSPCGIAAAPLPLDCPGRRQRYDHAASRREELR